MMRVLTPILFTCLLISNNLYSNSNNWNRYPGNYNKAVNQLQLLMQKHYSGDIFELFNLARVHRPNLISHDTAKKLLALYRMGKISVNSDGIKRAYIYMFLTAFADETRQHELLKLYQGIAAKNSENPTWRIIQARSAKMMWLPEVIQLYEQVANDMKGVAPNEIVKRVWEINHEEFDLAPYTKEEWLRHSQKFVYDGKGMDVPPTPAIKGSPFPFIDISAIAGPEEQQWQHTLHVSPLTQAKELDQLMAQAEKIKLLPWLNGRGFLNMHEALNLHLLSKPRETLVELRKLQELKASKAMKKTSNTISSLKLFRRYPWSQSAQQKLLLTATQQLFSGEAQAAYRSYRDVLNHTNMESMKQNAQVGVWLSLSQFSETEILKDSFTGVDPNAIWPWYGENQKTEVIKKELLKKEKLKIEGPTLKIINNNIVRLPPMPVTIINVDMQRNGNQLFVSCPSALAMYNSANTTQPTWVMNRQSTRHGGRFISKRTGQPQFLGKQLIASWGGDSMADYNLLALNRYDKNIIHSNNANVEQSRHLNRIIGKPMLADNKIYTLLLNQSHALMSRMHQSSWWGDIALACFDQQKLKLLWTRKYESANATGTPDARKMVNSNPTVSEGAVYIISNTGHVIKADSRDGKMEWIHFFRPSFNNSHHYSKPSSWSFGSAPLVTEDKVVCISKLSGRIFALDKSTGRRVWALPHIRAYEVLGRYKDLVLVSSANALYGIELNTGTLRWARQIVDHDQWQQQWTSGFQLPHSQLIGASIYCGTKNNLYRFDAKNGMKLETRPWKMKNETPMSFHISSNELYTLSDLTAKDAILEKQLVEHHTVIHPAGAHKMNQLTEIKSKAGKQLFYRDGMLFSIKDKKLNWCRFIPKAYSWFGHGGNNLTEKGEQLYISWSGTSSWHDLKTGKLMKMNNIKIGD